MYQSLHTTVLGTEGIPFEVQIRTWAMHETAEYGIAAHWKYKEGIQGKDKMEQRLAWVRQIIEAQQTSDDVEEIVRIIKTDLAPEDIVVMTPRGKSVDLPVGSTGLSSRSHSDILGRKVSLDYAGQFLQHGPMSLDYLPQDAAPFCPCLNSLFVLPMRRDTVLGSFVHCSHVRIWTSNGIPSVPEPSCEETGTYSP